MPIERLVDRKPGLTIDPSCKTLVSGFEGGYHYKRLQVVGTERYDVSPNKNRFSHVHDAMQYMMLGGGEGKALTRGAAQQPTRASTRFDVFAHAALQKRNRRPALKGW